MAYEPLENKYEFYQSFLKILTIEHYSNETEIPVFRNNLNKNAELVFKSYKADVGNREFDYDSVPYFDPIIMKRSGQGTVLFRHESFFEFLLAHYVGLRLQAVSIESIEVLSSEYTNDIADFISDQLKVKSTQEREQIRNNLIALYGLTISNNKQIEYNKLFNPIPLLPWLNYDNRKIIKTFRTQFEGMSPEREALLNEIKSKTLELLKARYGEEE